MLQLVAVDLKIEAISTAWLELLDHYARDPMGGGEGLPDYAKSHLVMALQNQPGFHGALAYDGEQAVGLINCFLGFPPLPAGRCSTFTTSSCMPIIAARASARPCCAGLKSVHANSGAAS